MQFLFWWMFFLPSLLCLRFHHFRPIRASILMDSMTGVAGISGTSAKNINRAIVDTFSRAHSAIDLERLRLLLQENSHNLNQINIITLMHRCSKYKQPIFSFLDPPTVLRLLNTTQPTSQGIANAIYSLQSMDKRIPQVHEIVTVLTRQLGRSTELFDGQAISNALYGLRGLNDCDPGVEKLLSAIHATIQRSIAVKGPDEKCISMTPQGIGSAFFGLQGFSCSSPSASSILAALTASLDRLSTESALTQTPKSNLSVPMPNTTTEGWRERSAPILDSQAFANILLGLKSCSCQTAEVKGILRSLSKHLTSHKSVLASIKANELSMAIAGLSGMRSETSEVVGLLKIINDALDRCVANHRTICITSGEQLGPLIGGLQGMSPSEPEVRRLLRHIYTFMISSQATIATTSTKKSSPSSALSPDVINASKPHQVGVPAQDLAARRRLQFTEGALAMALKGLQRCTSQHSEVLDIISLLSYTANTHEGYWRGESVGNALYGLRSMNSSSVEVRGLLRALTRRIDVTGGSGHADEGGFSPQNCAMALYGMQRMPGTSVEVQYAVNAIAAVIEADIERHKRDAKLYLDDDNKKSSNSAVSWSFQEIAMSMYGLQSMAGNSVPVKRLVTVLADRLEDCMGSAGKPRLPSEEQMNDLRRLQSNLSGQEIAMILHGMRGMTSSNPAVKKFISVLAACIAASPCVMSGAEISTSLGGLQAMGLSGIGSSQGGSVIYDDEVLSFAAPYAGQEKRWVEPPQVIGLLKALADKIALRPVPLSGPECCVSLYGIAGVSIEIGATRRIVSFLSQDLKVAARTAATAAAEMGMIDVSRASLFGRLAPPPGMFLESRHAALALYGLRNAKSSRKVVLDILDSLADCIDLSPYPFTAQGVGNALYGLQGMSSEKPEVRRLLGVIAAKIENMPCLGSKSAAGGANLSPDVDTDVVHDSQVDVAHDSQMKVDDNQGYELTGQNIGNALWGLRNMTDDHPEVCRALGAMAARIRASSYDLSGQNVANALYGLNSMSDSSIEVREVLAALAYKLLRSGSQLSGLDIGMALYGLRNMDSETPEVRVMLGLLILKIRQSDTKLQLRDLSRAMIGLLKAQEWIVDDFIRVLASKTPGMTTTSRAD